VVLPRFDSLRAKLFLAIAGGTATLALAAYVVFSWSFASGFVHYVNQADEERLQPLVARLAEGYGREGNWQWISAERRRWFELVRETVGLAPLTIDPRLLLLDAERTVVVGNPEAAKVAVLKPIEWQARRVGYLGYVPRPEMLESIERLYLHRQHLTFGAIAVGLLAAALALSAGLAWWLSRRISALAAGTDALIKGDYGIRLPVSGDDELARLARDFNALASTLAEAQTARRQWIADIAHELRTPLSILRGEIEALQDGVRPIDAAAIASLSGEASRLARLVEDLHTLSLSDLGALTYRKERLDLGEVVAESLEAQRPALEQKGLQADVRLDPQVHVFGDADRLKQVFGNLVQNSLRYTDAPGRIAVRVRKDPQRVVIDWEDSSPAVPPEDLSRLTQRLFRVEGSRSRASGGSGLGLAIARAIVEDHDGTLAARPSALGGLHIELAFPHG
jgi:two-component system, OmpR family, sensor histidine kinase BaeS